MTHADVDIALVPAADNGKSVFPHTRNIRFIYVQTLRCVHTAIIPFHPVDEFDEYVVCSLTSVAKSRRCFDEAYNSLHYDEDKVYETTQMFIVEERVYFRPLRETFIFRQLCETILCFRRG